MIPTVEQIKIQALEYLDDPDGRRYDDQALTAGFTEAYETLTALFLLYQITKLEKIVKYILPATTVSFTPADALIDNFGELIRLEERLNGSTGFFTEILQVDRLTQREAADILAEFVWRDDAFYLLGATTDREIQITYYDSGVAPLDGTVGVDGSFLMLSKLTAASVAPRKGEDERGATLKVAAVGKNFDDGVVGGDAWRLMQSIVRSRQQVKHAPRAFRAGVYRTLRRAPYIRSN